MSIFGQVWVFSAIAFVLGAFLAWVFLVRPARKQVRDLEARLASREADIRRISEPALGASDVASARADRNDPFSDADEALAAGGTSAADGTYGGPDETRQLEPETDWPERDSLAGAGERALDRDDFHLADQPDDLDVSGDRAAGFFGDRDVESPADRNGFDGGRYAGVPGSAAFAGDAGDSGFADRVADNADHAFGTDRAVEDEDELDAAFADTDRERDPRDHGYGDHERYDDHGYDGGFDGFDHEGAAGADEAGAEQTRYVTPVGDAEPTSAEPAGVDDLAGRGLHAGEPFQPVTTFDRTTELPVGAADTAEPQPDTRRPDDGHPEPVLDGDSEQAKKPGSLFEPGAVDESGGTVPGDSAQIPPAPAPADGAEPPAYAFGGPDAAPDEDPAESTNVLPKRTPRQRPPGGFDPPKPIQPSMRSVTRREPDADIQSGSLFEPSSTTPADETASAESAAPSEPAPAEPAPAEPTPGTAQETQSPRSEMTRFVAPAGQVPTGDAQATPGRQDGSDRPGAHRAATDEGHGEADDSAAGPFGPGSAMPLPGGGSPAPEFTVKASVTALRYVTDSSPQYPRMVAEVWFRSPDDAERVGFRPLSS